MKTQFAGLVNNLNSRLSPRVKTEISWDRGGWVSCSGPNKHSIFHCIFSLSFFLTAPGSIHSCDGYPMANFWKICKKLYVYMLIDIHKYFQITKLLPFSVLNHSNQIFTKRNLWTDFGPKLAVKTSFVPEPALARSELDRAPEGSDEE